MSFFIKIVIDNQYLYKIIAEEKKEISLGSSSKDNIIIRDFLPTQMKLVIRKNQLKVTGKNLIHNGPIFIDKSEQSTLVSDSRDIYISWVDYSGKSDMEFALPYRGIIKIGKSPKNHITINNPMISRNHVTLIIEDGKVRVEDGYNGKSSSNGTYLNGKRITKAVMKSGDCLDIVNHSIRLLNTKLLFENVEGILSFNPITIQDSKSMFENGSLAFDESREPVYRRSPRIREGLPQQEIVLAKAPNKSGMFQKRRGMFSSLLSSGAMLGASVATGMVSPALLAARAAGLVAPVANMAMNSGDNKKGKKEYLIQEQKRREKYGAYIEAQKSLIKLTADQQKKIISNENPSAETCFDIVKSLKPQLWERRPDNSDFLKVRIGMGYEPICVNVKTPTDVMGFQLEDDDVQEIAKQIVEETRIVDDVPARLSLADYSTIGIIGNRNKVQGLFKNLLVSLATLHFYDDVRIVGIFDKAEYQEWEMLRWLPHIWDEEKQSRFIAFDEENAERISDTFCDIFRQRLAEKEEYESRIIHPHYVFILGSYNLTRRLKVMQYLLENNPLTGVTTIFSYNLGSFDSWQQRTYLPPECQFVIDTDDVNGPCAYEFLRADKKFMFTQDAAISTQTFDWFCRRMSAIRVEAGIGKMELPGGITLFEGMGISNVKQLPTWRNRDDVNKSICLPVPVGIMQNGKMCEIDIGNFELGPVTLVAGMSGSGKSEFLKTWILALATKYSPEEISFVIIDYKGGSMAHSVSGLPHVSGIITDIDTGDIMRSLDSISYEIKRREKIVKEFGVKDLKDYLLNGYQKVNQEKLPYLIIVCDEFAELKQQHKEFISTLISIARLGRGLGIRLVLATQSPAGVVDQEMFDNSTYQVCLRVQNAAASKSMINQPDAARITHNGRAYVRSSLPGMEPRIDLVQSFWAGAPYLGNKETKASTGNQVRLVELSGQRIKTVWEEKTRFKSDQNELQASIRYISRIAEEDGLDRIPCVWKPELPKSFSLGDLNIAGGFDGYDWRPSYDWLRIPIGVYDRPELQDQGIQFIDFEQDGHFGIYGLPGTGKTVLLKTMVMSLGLCYTPDQVNIHIVDLGSQTMKLFSKMPHVSGIVLGSEEDKIQKMANYFGEVLAERKKIFARSGVTTLKSYRKQVDDKTPAIILVIDNFTPLFEICPDFEQVLYKIANEGAGYGIYLVFTANSTTGIRYKLTQNIKAGIAFEMNNNTDYNDVVGRVEKPEKIRNIKGRAYFRTSQGPVLFQTALYAPGSDEIELGNWINNVTEQMNKYWDGETATRIQFIPEDLSSKGLKDYYVERNIIPVGFYKDDAKPAYFNFRDKVNALILGETIEDVSSNMVAMINMLSMSEKDNQIYVIDSRKERLSSQKDAVAHYVISTDVESVDEQINSIIKELIERQKMQKNWKESKGDQYDNEEFLLEHAQICVFIDDLIDVVELLEKNEKAYDRMNTLLKHAAGLGTVFIAGGVSARVNEIYLKNSIVSKFTSTGMGIAISGRSKENTFYSQRNLSFSEKNNQINKGDGFFYLEGEAKKIKIMSSEE